MKSFEEQLKEYQEKKSVSQKIIDHAKIIISNMGIPPGLMYIFSELSNQQKDLFIFWNFTTGRIELKISENHYMIILRYYGFDSRRQREVTPSLSKALEIIKGFRKCLI